MAESTRSKVELKSNDPKLEAALEQVRTDRTAAERFASDPEKFLKSKGVDTSELQVGTSRAETVGSLATAGVCASVGCIACATVGT